MLQKCPSSIQKEMGMSIWIYVNVLWLIIAFEIFAINQKIDSSKKWYYDDNYLYLLPRSVPSVCFAHCITQVYYPCNIGNLFEWYINRMLVCYIIRLWYVLWPKSIKLLSIIKSIDRNPNYSMCMYWVRTS